MITEQGIKFCLSRNREMNNTILIFAQWCITKISLLLPPFRLVTFCETQSCTSWFLGSGPEEVNGLCFHTGEISPPPPPPFHMHLPPPWPPPLWDSKLSLKAQIPALRLISQPQSSNPKLEVQISASKLKLQLCCFSFSFEAQISAPKLNSSLKSQGSDLSLKA